MIAALVVSEESNKPFSLTEGKGLRWSFAVIFLLAAILRLHALGLSSLWIDEITIIGFGGLERTPSEIISHVYSNDLSSGETGQHMPMQYVLMNVFLRLCDHMNIEPSGFHYRFPFALLGLLTIPVLYGIGATLYDRRAGLWTMFLGAVSFFHVYQSRDATGYAPFLFFVALNFLGLALLFRRRDGPPRELIVPGVVFVLGSMGAFFSHLSSWIILGIEGVLLVACVFVIAVRKSEEDTSNYYAAAKPLALPIGLLVLSTLPFIPIILMALGNAGETDPGTPPDSFSIPLLIYQLAHFGLGRGQGRLIAYLVFLVAGAVWVLRDKELRKVGLFHIALCILPAIAFFKLLHRDFFPRYLAVVYLPWLCLAGVGASGVIEMLIKGLRLPEKARVVATTALVLAVLAWAYAPMQVMLNMTDKLMPFSRIQKTLMELVPEGGLYVMRNGYHMREIPGTHEVPGRHAAYADFPNAGIPEHILQFRSDNARSMFARFPMAVLIADMNFSDPRWSWMNTDLAKKVPIVDDSIAKLYRWGLSPHGIKNEQATPFVALYNTEEDFLWRRRGSATVIAWPIGAAWRYMQMQQGELMVTPLGGSQLKVANFGQPGNYELILRAAGTEPGSLMVQVGSSGQTYTTSYSRGSPLELRLGPFMLDQGESILTISSEPRDRISLLIFEFLFQPAQDQSGQGEQTEGNDVEGENTGS